MKQINRKALCSVALLAVFGMTLVAQVPVVSKTAPAKAVEKTEKTEKEKKPEEKDTFFHIRNVELHPVVGPVLLGTDILVKNGKIEAIGQDLDIPDGAEVLDAKGLHAYPGLVSLNGDGILGGGSGKWQDRFDPHNIKALMAISNGITTVVSRLTAVKLTYV